MARERRSWRARRRPATHAYALVLLLVALALMLSTDALVQQPDRASEPVGPPVIPGSSRGGVIDVGGGRLRTARVVQDGRGLAVVGLPARPVLDRTLERFVRDDVRGTWFLAGEDIRQRRADVARIRDAGFELGVTGYTGADLRREPPWRLRLELSLAQAALAARAGIVAPLLLLPATPGEDTLDRRSLRAARTAATSGYLLVATGDEPSAGSITLVDLRRDPATAPPASEAGVLPVSAAVGLRPSEVNQRASWVTRANAVIVLGTIRIAEVVVGGLRWLFLPVTVAILARAALALVFATAHARRRRRPRAPGWTGPVTIAVPAYNEEAGIVAAVRSFVASDWPHGLEVVVIDDGSTDRTAEAVEALESPGVRVVRQANAGKPAALNAAIERSDAEVLVFVDGDTLFQPDTVRHLVGPLEDPRVGAVSGNAKVLNRGALLGRWQHIEYVMGFNLDRRLLDTFGAIPTVPGAVGAFRRRALVAVGGVSEDTLAEDTDLTVALARHGWRVRYEPRAIAWTEAPSSLGDLWRQRYRWSYGTLQAAWKHRRAFVERRAIGPVGLTYALVFQVLLALLGPVLDVAALHALFTGDEDVLRIWTLFVVAQVALAAFAFLLDGESLRPLWAVPLQQVVYRQLMYLVVIQSVIAAFSGTRLRWHKLHRVGLEGHGREVPSGSPVGPGRGVR